MDLGSHIKALRTLLQWQKGRSLLWQVVGVLFALSYITFLHLGNDGLWYQGDAPRHAANGLFWWDFLTNFSTKPVDFALSYYARYPVIHPTAYPPGFYLIEGTAFQFFGASPFVAKGLVFAFTVLACVYVIAWIRRWISKEAGWGSVLLILQPGIILWANAVMLNVPSMALGLAALYHARRWIETATSRHLYLASFFTLFGILTYVHSGIVLFVILAWIVVEQRWIVLWDRRVLIIGLLSVLVLLPWVWVIVRWAPTYVAGVSPSTQFISMRSTWTFYLSEMVDLFTTPLLALAIIGVVVGLCDWRWRQEIKLLLIWIIVCYGVLSYIVAREPRYILPLSPAIVFLSVIGLISLLHRAAVWFRKNSSWFFLSGMAALLVFHIFAAPFVRVPIVKGFREVVEFFEKVAPEERIFYDGVHNGVFSFYMCAGDPDFKRGVVLGNKLLYASSIFPTWLLAERVSSPADVVEVLRMEGGCKWIAIERQGSSDEIRAARYLRQALTGSHFKFIKSFPIVDSSPNQVDVYQFLPPVEKPDKIELRFPSLGEEGGVFRVKPIK